MEAPLQFRRHRILQLLERDRIRFVILLHISLSAQYNEISHDPSTPLSAIVFPTLWEYLQSLGVPSSQTYYLGLCFAGTSVEMPLHERRLVNPTRIFISAPSFTDIFASFLAGRWADKFSRVSYLLLSLTLAEVFASALYLVARDERIQRKFLLNRCYLL